MGSSSVSCGMSKLPIVCNEDILFIALKQNFDHKGNPNGSNTDCIIFGEREFYKPYFLPIEGKYNTYGSLEKIVKNENTDLLEKHYNKSIEQILSTITNGRSIFDNFSEIPKIWDLTCYEKNSLNSLKRLGFELIKENNQEFMYNKDYDLKLFSQDSSKFEISSKYTLKYSKTYQTFDYDKMNFVDEKEFFEKNIKIVDQISGNSLQIQIYDITNIILGLKNPDDMYSLNQLNKLSGMIVLKEVYEKMSNNLNFDTFNNDDIFEVTERINKESIKPIHLKKLGFEIIDNDNFKFNEIDIVLKYSAEIKINGKTYSKGRYISNVRELIKFLNSKTNYNFDTTNIKDIIGVKAELLNLRDEIDYSLNILQLPKEKLHNLFGIMFRGFDDKNNIFRTNNLYKDKLLKYLVDNDLNNDFVNNLCIELDKFNTFKGAMVATNTFYMPTYSGYQDGCFEMSKYLNDVTSSILKERFKDYELDMEND